MIQNVNAALQDDTEKQKTPLTHTRDHQEGDTDMSELIEKMCVERVGGQARWDDHSEPWRMVERDRMRAALAILTKPENITPSMRDALWNGLNLERYSSLGFNFSEAEVEVLLNQAIAAAIGAIVSEK